MHIIQKRNEQKYEREKERDATFPICMSAM